MDALACALISIHAPTRGATTGQYGYANWKNDFNPRSYKRSDLLLFYSYHTSLISIHAPTRGATYKLLRHTPKNRHFNPRSYKRSDYLLVMSSRSYYYFNPRSYKRSDDKFPRCVHRTVDFNPRSYKRSDISRSLSSISAFEFQSTLLQEERPFWQR